MDPFGYSAERHEARALVETYEGAVRDMRRVISLPFVPRLMARTVGVGFRREQVRSPEIPYGATSAAQEDHQHPAP